MSTISLFRRSEWVRQSPTAVPLPQVPFPYHSAAELLDLTRKHGIRDRRRTRLEPEPEPEQLALAL